MVPRCLPAPGSSLADCQVDCQPFVLAMFSLDGGGRVQAADLVIWTATDRLERRGRVGSSPVAPPPWARVWPADDEQRPVSNGQQ